MSIRRPPSLEPTAAPQGRLDAVLRVGVHTRPSRSSRSSRSSLAYGPHDVDGTDGFFDGTKMRLQATRFVDAGVIFTQTEDAKCAKAARSRDVLVVEEPARDGQEAKQIYAITDIGNRVRRPGVQDALRVSVAPPVPDCQFDPQFAGRRRSRCSRRRTTQHAEARSS